MRETKELETITVHLDCGATEIAARIGGPQ
jgi:hypothetical protein